MRAAAALTAVIALLTSSACAGEFVEIKSEGETTVLVQRKADKIAAIVGMPLDNPKIGPLPCTGKRGEGGGSEIYSIQGAYQIDARAGEMPRSVVSRLREDWSASGYNLERYEELGEHDAIVEAKTGDGFKLSFASISLNSFAVFVFSPCYTRP